MVPEQSKRLSPRMALWVAGSSVAACALVWTGWGIRLYWNDVRLINFLAAWIPFVLSTLLAFVPEHKMTTTKKWLWRCSVMLVGLSWSVVLWHQQVVTDATARKDQETIVTSAVSQANVHSDEQIGFVRKDVQGVKKDLGDTAQKLSDLFVKSENDLSTSIGKVGKPEPPELAKIEFHLLDDKDSPTDNPTLHMESDGTYAVNFLVTNDSNVQAESIDVWVHICGLCSFAKEPAGFEHPAGEMPDTRHVFIGSLNAGVSYKKLTINFNTTALTPNVGIAFSESCKNCGKVKRTSDFVLHLNLLTTQPS